MSSQVIKTTGKHLERTRERMLITAMLMAEIEQQLPVGRRSNRTKRFLAVNLAILIADYEKSISELTEQLQTLQALAQSLGGAQ